MELRGARRQDDDRVWTVTCRRCRCDVGEYPEKTRYGPTAPDASLANHQLEIGVDQRITDVERDQSAGRQKRSEGYRGLA